MHRKAQLHSGTGGSGLIRWPHIHPPASASRPFLSSRPQAGLLSPSTAPPSLHPGDAWPCGAILSLSQPCDGGCSWPRVGRGRGYLQTSHKAQDNLPQQRIVGPPNVTNLEVEKPQFRATQTPARYEPAGAPAVAGGSQAGPASPAWGDGRPQPPFTHLGSNKPTVLLGTKC